MFTYTLVILDWVPVYVVLESYKGEHTNDESRTKA